MTDVQEKADETEFHRSPFLVVVFGSLTTIDLFLVLYCLVVCVCILTALL